MGEMGSENGWVRNGWVRDGWGLGIRVRVRDG